ncbi:GNAT family N-acetyltransferase [Pseudomonas huanghezhanensis]|uniref:GNAT family N-acetyltransferase n=1 Tax=Pseudomonas huanghezhanensis TaxID=3002903 RepID=UPI00228549D1|nr:GNAT family N-acetyltransferase [Pseudomonas sp. BSw22131]
MTLADYDAVIDLMKRTPGVTFRDADSRESTARYLQRNPGLSFVAKAQGELVGCVMCGHDGRRGYLQHLIVAPEHRRQGLGASLVERCLSGLEQEGIVKCHLDVIKTNSAAAQYWSGQGWSLRTDIDRYSLIRSGDHNA